MKSKNNQFPKGTRCCSCHGRLFQGHKKGRGDCRSLMERNRVEDGEASLGFSTEERGSCLAPTVYNTFLEFNRVMLSAPPQKKVGGMPKLLLMVLAGGHEFRVASQEVEPWKVMCRPGLPKYSNPCSVVYRLPALKLRLFLSSFPFSVVQRPGSSISAAPSRVPDSPSFILPWHERQLQWIKVLHVFTL